MWGNEAPPQAESSQPAQPQAPAVGVEVVQYGPKRSALRPVQRRQVEAVRPFASVDRPRENNPRRIFGEMQSEMLAAERRSFALESELSEAVDIFQQRENWWKERLLKLREDIGEAIGSERYRFVQLEHSAEAEFRNNLIVLIRLAVPNTKSAPANNASNSTKKIM